MLLALLGGGCASIVEVPVETPLQSKLDVSRFRRILIAGFVTDLEPSESTSRPRPRACCRTSCARTRGCRCSSPTGPPLQEALDEGAREARRAGPLQQGREGAVPARGRQAAAGPGVLAQDGRGVPAAARRHRQARLRESRTARASSPRSASCARPATGGPTLVRGNRYMERKGYSLSADFYFIDTKTRRAAAQGALHRGGALLRGPAHLAALVVLRADGPAPAELPGRDHAPEDPRARASCSARRRAPACAGSASARSLLAALAALATLPRPAAAQFIPYYGKNKVKYDNFAWRVYKSPHFEVFYYPEFEQHLARLVSYLESGYLKLSTGLKHEMPEPIPVIFYKTHSEFEQTNLFPAFVPEGWPAFTEPVKNRMVMPIDEPPGPAAGADHARDGPRLRLRPHPARARLRHPAARDPALGRRGTRRLLPRPVGPARPDDDPRRGPHRQGARSSRRPSSRPSPGASSTTWATPASSSWRRATARRASGSSSTRCARGSWAAAPRSCSSSPSARRREEFDAAFDKWLKERFKPFRDRQRPDDFGRDLSPDAEKTSFTQVFAFAPEPVGRDRGDHHRATATRARPTSCSSRPRTATSIRNLTGGFDNDWENLTINSEFVGRPHARLRPERRLRRLLRAHRQAAQLLPGLGPRRLGEAEGADPARRAAGARACSATGGRCCSPRSRRASRTSTSSTSTDGRRS